MTKETHRKVLPSGECTCSVFPALADARQQFCLQFIRIVNLHSTNILWIVLWIYCSQNCWRSSGGCSECRADAACALTRRQHFLPLPKNKHFNLLTNSHFCSYVINPVSAFNCKISLCYRMTSHNKIVSTDHKILSKLVFIFSVPEVYFMGFFKKIDSNTTSIADKAITRCQSFDKNQPRNV